MTRKTYTINIGNITQEEIDEWMKKIINSVTFKFPSIIPITVDKKEMNLLSSFLPTNDECAEYWQDLCYFTKARGYKNMVLVDEFTVSLSLHLMKPFNDELMFRIQTEARIKEDEFFDKNRRFYTFRKPFIIFHVNHDRHLTVSIKMVDID